MKWYNFVGFGILCIASVISLNWYFGHAMDYTFLEMWTKDWSTKIPIFGLTIVGYVLTKLK